MSRIHRSRQTVFVVEDEEFMREALALPLSRAGYACKAFPDATTFLGAFDRWPASRRACLVLDTSLPGISGLELQEHLNANPNGLPIVFVTGPGDITAAAQAMKGGAVDVLPKPVNAEDLLERTAAALRADVERRRRRRVRNELLDRLSRLTPREKQVFERVTRAVTNNEVALDLGISIRTVEIHRRRTIQKMQARNIVDLVRMRSTLDAARC